jgi:hypothetical protein
MGKTYTADSFKTTEGIDLFIDKLSKGGYTGDAQDIVNIMNGYVAGSTIINEVTPSSAIPATGNIHAFVTTAGTYTNWNSSVLAANSFGILTRVSGVYSLSQTALDISSKVNVSDVINTLISTETTKPLSAAQGKVLNDKSIELYKGAFTENYATPISKIKDVKYYNLFNNLTIVNGYYLNTTNGALIVNSAYGVSNFMPVKESTYYKRTTNEPICFYDKNEVYLSGEWSNDLFFTTPLKCYFVKTSLQLVNIDTLQISEGNELLNYKPYSYSFNGIDMYKEDDFLPTFKSSIAKLRNGYTSVYNINFHGDSITEGVNAGTNIQFTTKGFVGLLRSKIQSIYGDTGYGVVPVYAPVNIPFWTFSAGWQNSGIGFSGQGKLANTIGETASITFKGTGFQIIRLAGTSTSTFGEFYVSIDGGANVTYSNINAYPTGQFQLNVATGLTNTTHTIVITTKDTKQFYFNGGYEINANSGFRINMIGKSGITSSGGVGGGVWGATGSNESLNPVLSVIGLLTNDLSTGGITNIETYKLNIETLIISCKKSGDVILLSNCFRKDQTESIQKPFINVLSQLSKKYNCVFLDMHSELNGKANSLGLMADDVHPNNAGHYYMASKIYKLLENNL